MPNLQKAFIIGHVGRISELKSKEGSSVKYTRFAVAVSEGKDDKKATTWYDCIAFGKQAENFVRFVTVGSVILVEGSMKIKAYMSKTSEPKASVEITAQEIVYLTIKKSDGPKSDDDLPF